MSETYDFDMDREAIRIDDRWLTAGDIAALIQDKVSSGDFRVARLSIALEQLEEMLSTMQSVNIKLTPEVLDTFQRLAAFEKRPLPLVLRRGLVHYLGSEDAAHRLFRMHRGEDDA
jgi:hypothetical protein